jgi:hypothetical protein
MCDIVFFRRIWCPVQTVVELSTQTDLKYIREAVALVLAKSRGTPINRYINTRYSVMCSCAHSSESSIQKREFCLQLRNCRRYAVAQLVEALRYKLESRGLDSRWCHLNFTLTLTFRPHHDSEIDSVSDRNVYQEYFLFPGGGGKSGRCVGLTILPTSCSDCIEIWEPQTPRTLRVCPGL